MEMVTEKRYALFLQFQLRCVYGRSTALRRLVAGRAHVNGPSNRSFFF